MTQATTDFQARLKRINDPENILYRDPETEINIPRRLSIGQIKEHNFGDKPRWWAVAFSLVLGVIGMIAARYVRFVYADIPEVGTEALTLFFMDLGLASLLTLVVGGFLGLKSLRHFNAQLTGIVLGLMCMHNFVWMMPEQTAKVFPQSYVQQVQKATEPQSLYVIGKIYTL